MAHSEENVHVTVLPPDKAKIKKLWTVALYLLIITVIEFIIAFSVPHEFKSTRVAIFIAMTIVKAALNRNTDTKTTSRKITPLIT